MQLTEKTFETGGITLSYDEGAGTGAPMVLLHGLTGMRQTWQSTFIPKYGDSWHQYAIDLRGHGKSGHASDDTRYRIVDYVEDIIDFIHNKVDAPPVIVGHSLGAMTAIGVGAGLGDKARGLILLDPPLPVRELPVSTFPGAFGWFSWVYNTLSASPSFDQLIEACRAMNPVGSDDELKGMAIQVQNLSTGTVKAALENRIEENFDFAEALSATACPILLMYGEFGESASMRDVDAEFVAQHAKQLTTVKFPYDDHSFHQNYWHETHPHITAFLETL